MRVRPCRRFGRIQRFVIVQVQEYGPIPQTGIEIGPRVRIAVADSIAVQIVPDRAENLAPAEVKEIGQGILSRFDQDIQGSRRGGQPTVLQDLANPVGSRLQVPDHVAAVAIGYGRRFDSADCIGIPCAALIQVQVDGPALESILAGGQHPVRIQVFVYGARDRRVPTATEHVRNEGGQQCAALQGFQSQRPTKTSSRASAISSHEQFPTQPGVLPGQTDQNRFHIHHTSFLRKQRRPPTPKAHKTSLGEMPSLPIIPAQSAT